MSKATFDPKDGAALEAYVCNRLAMTTGEVPNNGAIIEGMAVCLEFVDECKTIAEARDKAREWLTAYRRKRGDFIPPPPVDPQTHLMYMERAGRMRVAARFAGDERRAKVLALMGERGLGFEELCRRVGASPVTVRNDMGRIKEAMVELM